MKVKDNSDIPSQFSQNILTYPIHKYRILDEKQEIIQITDQICHEGPLEIRVAKENKLQFESIAITMRTVGNDYELAAGFLFTEGIIDDYSQLLDYHIISDNIIEITLANSVDIDLKSAKRRVFTSSSCGICSKGNLKSLEFESPYLSWTSKQTFESSMIYGISRIFKSADSIFSITGANHAVVLIDENGQDVIVKEDVGRHNAMDKLIGYSLNNDLFPLKKYAMVLSGRISFELVQKAAMTGVPLIIALGAPSSLAIDEAFAQNICLIGFTKDHSFNVYSSFERII